MRSFTSNFKNKLRLPRLFFRKPLPSESVHGGPPLEYERPIPQQPWRGIAVHEAKLGGGSLLLLLLGLFIYCRQREKLSAH